MARREVYAVEVMFVSSCVMSSRSRVGGMPVRARNGSLLASACPAIASASRPRSTSRVRMKENPRITYPVPPVASVVTVRLAHEVVHRLGQNSDDGCSANKLVFPGPANGVACKKISRDLLRVPGKCVVRMVGMVEGEFGLCGCRSEVQREINGAAAVGWANATAGRWGIR